MRRHDKVMVARSVAYQLIDPRHGTLGEIANEDAGMELEGGRLVTVRFDSDGALIDYAEDQIVVTDPVVIYRASDLLP